MVKKNYTLTQISTIPIQLSSNSKTKHSIHETIHDPNVHVSAGKIVNYLIIINFLLLDIVL